MFGKEKLVFDPTDADGTDNTGAYLRSPDGTLLTHTTDGAKERLDVSTGAEQVSGGDYTVGDKGNLMLAVDPNGDYAPVKVNADGELLVDVQVTSGADKAEDSAHVSGDIGAYVLSVREDALTTSTSASGDYQSLKTDSVGALWTRLAQIPQSNGFVAGNVDTFSVTTSAQALPASPLSNRKELTIQNTSNRAIYYGYSNTVTVSNGIRISAGAFATIKADASLLVYVISDSAVSIRYEELA